MHSSIIKKEEVMAIPLGEYIFRRLYSIGIKHIFGVPGDFNLNLLDHIDSVDGLEWVGNRNELNGTYAADGYARSRGLPGVVVTTFGVGELSAINGIGGAYSEHVPIIHIAGTTSRAAQKARLMIHHTLGESIDHLTYMGISQVVSIGSAFLNDDAKFTQEVDRVIELCFKMKLPVYLYVPIDVPDILVDSSRLDVPLQLDVTNDDQHDLEDSLVDEIAATISNAARPSFLIDMLTQRFGLTKEVRELLQLTGMPGFTTPMGKSIIDENSDNYGGMYHGAVTKHAEVKEAFESSDLVISIGHFPSDSNTGGFSQKFPEQFIACHPNYVAIGKKKHNLSFVPVIRKLLSKFRTGNQKLRQAGWGKWHKPNIRHLLVQRQGPLRQSDIWDVFSTFICAGDTVIAEVGSSQFGSLNMALPSGAEYYTQLFYSSIGFTVGATLGTLIARKEQKRSGKVILFVGDGSLQMTVQEISTMIHNGLTPTIVIINNSGYTVERVIHGPNRRYNDVDVWDYQQLLRFFGAPPEASSYIARTYEELRAVLGNAQFQANENIQLLECVLDRYDSPQNLLDLVDSSMERTAAELSRDDESNNRYRVEMDVGLTKTRLGQRFRS